MKPEKLLEQLKVVLPKYLTPSQQRDLWEELRSFPETTEFYLPDEAGRPEILQGDGWTGFVAVNVESLERRSVRGIVISNSCDVDLSNPRTLVPNILFAPLISVSAYTDRLRSNGMTEERITGVLTSIRRQEVSQIFHLPERAYGPSESVVLLDAIHHQPITMFAEGSRSQLFRLNQVAFYAFLIKLSIHFTRFNEGVARFPLSRAS